jgi:hypothetical protein
MEEGGGKRKRRERQRKERERGRYIKYVVGVLSLSEGRSGGWSLDGGGGYGQEVRCVVTDI